jgi:hypothetical protein
MSSEAHTNTNWLLWCTILYHVIECDVTGVWIGIGFIGYIDTARDYTFEFTVTHTHTHTLVSSLPLLGSGLQRRKFPFLCVPKLFPCLRDQLLIETAHNDWTAAVLLLSHSVANQLTLLVTSQHGPHKKHHSPVVVYGPLPGNGRCTVTYLAVDAYKNGSTCHNM